MSFTVKKLSSEYLCGAAELEKLCFSAPWSEDSLAILCKEGGVGYAAIGENDGTVLAYGGMLTVLDEGQITNIATHPEYRRRGLGEAVVRALIEYGKQNGINVISLEVRESNALAISLYEKFGFFVAGKRKNFYTNPRENALVMIKNLD
jgi:ribosomal-protein-alanine N-acetyltransferase